MHDIALEWAFRGFFHFKRNQAIQSMLLVGLGGTEGSLIIHCYALGNVSGEGLVGGLVGYASASIVNCYAAGSVSGTTYIGGLVGRGGNIVVGSFWDIETSGQPVSEGGTGITSAEMMDPNTLINAGWNFVGAPDGPGDSWAEPDGGGYPILWWQLRPVPELPTFSGGTGESHDPYLISTAAELNSIGQNPRLMTAHFRLIADIDLADDDSFIIGGRWNPFTGIFDGDGHTISNFSHSSEYANSAGFFGRVNDARISDLGLIDPVIDVERGDFHGALVGYLDGGTITNCYAEGASISGNDHVGGLVGHNDGTYWTATISRCYVTGYVTGDDDVGGLVGSNDGKIADCYATAEVRGNKRVGGLAGTGTLRPSGHGGYARVIERCFAVGRVSGDEYVGGLVGQGNYGRNCFWDIETSGQSSRAGEGGRTTAEMQTADTFLDAGWDFVGETENGTEDIWCICQEPGYPTFAWTDFLQ